MVAQGGHIQVLSSWEGAEGLQHEWNALAAAAAAEHPFFSHDWFAFWYPAYAPAENVRIFLLRHDDGRLRAILPGFLRTRSLGGLTLRCFNYAANGYSPYGGIIAAAGDREAVRLVLQAVTERLRPAPHMIILPAVPDNSDTAAVICENGLRRLGRRIEHTEVVTVFSMPTGWEAYFSGRSPKTRKRLKESQARCRKLGRLEFEEFATPEHSAEMIDRIRRLDARSWQGQQGTGLFSIPENERFYRQLFSFRFSDLGLRVYLATIEGRDAAYSITVAAGNTRHVLKIGYDPDFSHCSPGTLTMAHVGERAAADGMRHVDLGAGFPEDKRHWETGRKQLVNWWLTHRRSFRGCMLEAMLRLHDACSGKRRQP